MARPASKLITLGVALGLALAVGLGLGPGYLLPLLSAALLWAQAQGAIGVMAYVSIYNLATVLFIPGALLTLVGGALYGVLWGTVYALLAATLGATLAFLLGRYVARGPVCRRLRRHPHVWALDQAVARSGFKIVLLTRLSPLLPFNLLNYAYGVTSVSPKDYLLGSLGMVPGTVLYVYLGALAGDIATLGTQTSVPAEAQVFYRAVYLLGLGATAAVTLWLARQARMALQHTVTSTVTSSKL